MLNESCRARQAERPGEAPTRGAGARELESKKRIASAAEMPYNGASLTNMEACVQKSTPRAMRPFEWLLLIILSVLWGGSFFFSLLARAGATNVLLVTLLIPVSALLLAALVVVQILFSFSK